ncbi:MAG: family 16 glycosylhydrolase [Victivallales bacterium]|nr:family 16 glycosylhydrolase [Victivallales bacterium]
MKKATFLLIIAAFSLFAGTLQLDSTFNQLDEKGASRSWVLNQWTGYNPLPTLTVLKGVDNEMNVIRMDNIASSHGGAFVSVKRFPARCGDLLRFSFRARGKGKAELILGCMLADGTWNIIPPQSYSFSLGEEWNDHLCSLRVPNGPNGETGLIYVGFHASQNSVLEVSNITATHEEGLYRGSERFPERWTLFGEVDANYAPTAEELVSIPEQLAGVDGKLVFLKDNTLDFAQIMGRGQNKCGWAFATLNSQCDCEYTLGAGADWWMAYYLNGEKLIDTFPNGNKDGKVDFTNYIVNAHLKKGKNIIAIKFVAGSASSELKVGGPEHFNNIVKKIKLSKIDWIDSFDNGKNACTGNPEIIQGNPTPGLLSVTGQAVFKTDGTIAIDPPNAIYDLPQEEGMHRIVGIRIQNFGREPQSRKDSTLSFVFSDGDDNAELCVKHKATSGILELEVTRKGAVLAKHSISYNVLPADFLFAGGAKGKYSILVNSLADSSSTLFTGDNPFFTLHQKGLKLGLVFKALDGTAEVVTDNFMVGRASEASNLSKVPFKVEPLREFDPVKAGWKQVFSEEFNGTELDLEKWYHGYSSLPERLKIKDGVCEIVCDWNEQKSKVTSASIYTIKRFGYGYFEARVKFRKEHGWWSAFWICNNNCSNPFYDSFEIDVYEDYYLRSEKPGGQPRDILDHNLHVFAGDCLKSWNYHSKLPGSLDEFYTIGCKWTPFEISYYMNGKLIESSANHSPYNSVTFDPFNHAAGTTPMKAILSGCCGKSGGDPKNGKFPESFFCDFVRVYEYPEDDIPSVTWVKDASEQPFVVQQGTTLTFEAKPMPSSKTKSPIKNVYLFDSGYLLEHKSEPPYTFDVMLTKEYYDTTDYVRPGRQGKYPAFGCALHAYSVFVQDEAGNVAHTEPVLKYFAPTAKSRPYKGKAQVIPGRLMLGDYDEGGPSVAYMDTTPDNTFGNRPGARRTDEGVDLSGNVVGGFAPWEWMNYTVDIQKAAKYKVTLHYGTPLNYMKDALILLDGVIVGRFPIRSHGGNTFEVDTTSTVEIELPAGRHELKFLALSGGFNTDYIDFEAL